MSGFPGLGSRAAPMQCPGRDRLSGVAVALQGRNVMIEQTYGGPKITKDGVTVAKVPLGWARLHPYALARACDDWLDTKDALGVFHSM